ncbi:helix-turn-helix domain-containing protein [Paenibacillus ehimensis]|uniref:helix-turn-helix domain-containing protein n=1 Tax=Paenibacillus ehimensis TaxID=79264 RepID=UPI0004726D02|nr:helix-turn-helix domain-containing protein [Paenibacillus ehimensis]
MREVMELLKLAQNGDRQAELELLCRYERLLHKYAWHHGQYHEDCKQHLVITFIKAVRRFDLERYIP